MKMADEAVNASDEAAYSLHGTFDTWYSRGVKLFLEISENL